MTASWHNVLVVECEKIDLVSVQSGIRTDLLSADQRINDIRKSKSTNNQACALSFTVTCDKTSNNASILVRRTARSRKNHHITNEIVKSNTEHLYNTLSVLRKS
jgi:hypothetical protein